jgi:hypothetical protein
LVRPYAFLDQQQQQSRQPAASLSTPPCSSIKMSNRRNCRKDERVETYQSCQGQRVAHSVEFHSLVQFSSTNPLVGAVSVSHARGHFQKHTRPRKAGAGPKARNFLLSSMRRRVNLAGIFRFRRSEWVLASINLHQPFARPLPGPPGHLLLTRYTCTLLLLTHYWLATDRAKLIFPARAQQ